MPFLFNDPVSGAISAKLTELGRFLLLKEGKLNATRFRLFDTEIQYGNFNVDNIDQDDTDITSQAVFDGTPDQKASEYSIASGNQKGGNVLLSQPYYIVNQKTVVGNKIVDNPFYNNTQEIILDINSLTGSDMLASTSPVTGITQSINYFSIRVTAQDTNGSALNGTQVSLYQKGNFLETRTLQDNTVTTFSNLTSNLHYRITVHNQGYVFTNNDSGVAMWAVSSLVSNYETKFVASALAISASSITVSGTVTNGITLAALSNIAVKLHSGSASLTASTNGSGEYSFSGLSSNIAYFVTPSSSAYYLNENVSMTGILTANAVHNFSLFANSNIEGNVYYYNTTNPISNAIINLYQGTTGASSNAYLQSVATDKDGRFVLRNIPLQQNYFLRGALQNYTFVNSPYVIPSSTYTASLTSIVIYAKKTERPVNYDTPFPFRRRNYFLDDKTYLPIFYDPCSWIFYTKKYGTLGYYATVNNNPITHEQVLMSNNYFDLIKTFDGNYTFTWDSKQKYTDSFNNESYSSYISDNYTIRIGIYALPYKNTLGENALQWDEYSKTDIQATFPQQVNTLATDYAFVNGQTVNYVDIVPQFTNNQLALSLNDVNKLPSLLPRTAVNVPVTVNSNNAIPNLGLLLSNSFNIDKDILQVSINPFEASQNGEYVSYTSIQGTEKQIPIQTVVNDFEDVSVTTIQDKLTTNRYNINGTPIPIFIPNDSFTLSQYYTNNLASPFSFSQFTQTIKTNGFIWDRVITWSVTGNEYTALSQSTYLKINAFGESRNLEQLYFVPNANHYSVSQDFVQFLISYFGIPSTDSQTIFNVTRTNSLIDWIFYIYLINFGAYKNSYLNGQLTTLLNITKQAKLCILYDIMKQGKNLVQAITDISNTGFKVSQEALDFFTANVPTTQANVLNATVSTTTQTSNGNSSQAEEAAFTFSNSISQRPTNPNTSIASNPNQPIVTQGQTPQPANTVQLEAVNTNAIISQQYITVTRELFRVITVGETSNTIKEVYGFIVFEFSTPFVIIITSFNQTPVTDVIKKPITRIDVKTQTITPIIQRIIKMQNINNYFNLYPSLEKKLKMTLKFDLNNPSTQDNFIKMINYLNDKLYTFYLGVEIIDGGEITKSLNNSIYTTDDYVQAEQVVKDGLCLQDKALFMIPLTLGNIKQQTTMVTGGRLGTSTQDPVTFNGVGYVKYIPYSDTTAHILRVIKLSNVQSPDLELINNAVVTGDDYIAFDLLQVDTNADLRQIRRYFQLLSKYDYNTMQQDLNDLRSVLLNQYSSIAGVSYVGSFGGGFAQSAKLPNIWTSSLIDYPQGTTALAQLDKILRAKSSQDFIKEILNMGQYVNNISDFSLT